MPKVNLTDISTISAGSIVAAYNGNNTTIEQAFDNTLSRNGASPNEMNANLDMNSHRILNLPAPNSSGEPVRQSELDSIEDDISDLSDRIDSLAGATDSAVAAAQAAAASAQASKNTAVEAAIDATASAASASSSATSAAVSAASSAINATNASNSAVSAAVSAAEASQIIVNYRPTVVRLSGNGTTTVFDTGIALINVRIVNVYISGLYQQKNTFTVAGTNITFSTAPPTGTNNIEIVISASSAMVTAIPTDGSVVTNKLADDAVTLAKLAGGTAGVLLGFDGSGNPSEVPLATEAQAEAATNNTAPMTPLRTAQSILKNAETAAYTPPNVSVTTRTIQSALREFSFAQDRGAFGADPAANTAKLQAVFADYPYGTRVILPRGTIPFAPFTVPDFIKLEGDGSGTTALIFSHATGDSIVLGADVCVTGVVINYDVVRTSGRTFYWLANGTGLEDVQIYNYFIGVENGLNSSSSFTVDPYMRRCRLNDGVVATGTAAAIFGNFSNGVVSDLVVSGTSSGKQQDCGLVLRRGDTFYIDKTNITRAGAALITDPAGPYSCLAVNVNNSHFDSSGQIYNNSYKNSAELSPTGGGQVKDVVFTGTWFGLSSNLNGAVVAPDAYSLVDGVIFGACQFSNNAGDGASIVGPNAKNILVNGSMAYGNGRWGLAALGGTTNFDFSCNRCGPAGGRGPNSYGIVVESGSAADNYTIVGNRCTGNTVSGLFDGGTGTNKVVANNLT